MNLSVIEQVIEQLRIMPHPQQQKVLQFARTLGHPELRGTPGQQLLKFAGTISSDDLTLMQAAIEQDCEQVDLNGW
ncbi:MAG: hypothetical protein ACFCU8_08475 [Thermosynechococcaceae cyanobacterium]